MPCARRSPLWAGLGRPILPQPLQPAPGVPERQDAWVVPDPVRNPTGSDASAADSRRRALQMDLQLDADGLAIGPAGRPGFERLAQGRSRAPGPRPAQAGRRSMLVGPARRHARVLSTEHETDLAVRHAGLRLRVQLARRDGAQLFIPAHCSLAARPPLLETAERRSAAGRSAGSDLTARRAQPAAGKHLRSAQSRCHFPLVRAYAGARRGDRQAGIEESLSMPQHAYGRPVPGVREFAQA